MWVNALGHLEPIGTAGEVAIRGLRKAKASYHPVKMVEKYVVRLA